MNLIEGITKEIERCRELLEIYEQIPTGKFGSIMIQRDISSAEKAMAESDTVEMIKCYKALTSCE